MMSKFLLINILLFAALFQTYSQNSGWIRQNSHSLNSSASCIYFINENTGWLSASGYFESLSKGAFLKTTDGGNNWVTILNDNQTSYPSFCFVNSLTGWLVGNSYYDITPGGWGYRFIYKTTDGGLNWVINHSDSTTTGFGKVFFLNQNTGWITARSLIFKTTNAGIHWDSTTITGTSYLTDVQFLDANYGWSTGGYVGRLYNSLNGGFSWNIVIDLNQNIPLWSIRFVNNVTGWVTGSFGRMFKTTSAGIEWDSLNIFTNQNLTQIYFLNPQTGYLTSGLYPDPNGVIYKSINGGLNWTQQYSTGFTNLGSIFFVNENIGWAGGIKEDTCLILKTTSGGIGIHEISTLVPDAFILSQNYPNPFNPSTSIKFAIPKAIDIVLIIYNALGQAVSTLVNEHLNPGTYSVEWNSSNFPSGVYFYKITGGNYSETKKMVLVK